MLNRIKKLRHKLYLALFHSMPIQNNKLVFFSNNAMSYSCNPKYLTEYILKKYPGKYQIVWVISTEIDVPQDIPEAVRIVRYFSIEYLKEISTAKFIICNTRIPPYFMFKKRKNQFYIQTWHGSLALKVIEQDAEDYLEEHYKLEAKADSAQIDMIPASSHLSAEQYRNGFWYDGLVMECGTPRSDIFFDEAAYTKLRIKYNIPQAYNVMLYAPTFRNDKEPDLFGIDFEKIKRCLKENTGKNWIIMFKLHPNLSNIVYNTDDKEIINMDSKSDLQELLVISDILITDYSSCMFDMGLMERKCVLYAPDIEDYISKERKMYFNIEELPFPLCRSNDELISTLCEFNEKEYMKRLKRFYDMIGNREDGTASEEIEKYISNKCFGK